ncbi:N-alpha-acetyltransferase 30 [Spironucleus salmonicida]|uniref:Acetyltransferase, GNAT family n=1 Tax=Spironucleus salmonicida TaxID=348837 RepID=V6LQP5_9EUKA|nr:N-alpha-acetyltransferase 30 [Spironucleus salmonicida]|eukprot:EST46997.1 Acetyltransferase, GNAT family [Spironucleus salmonicida]
MIEEQTINEIFYRPYHSDADLHSIKNLFSKELSEPYQVWTYRYFAEQYQDLTIFSEFEGQIVGCCMCMLQPECSKEGENKIQAYIGMISVIDQFKGKGVAQNLFKLIMQEFGKLNVTNIVLETEDDNHRAIRFYEKLGFYRSRHFYRYYMNGKGAYRLKKWLVKNE